eukprot:2704127-Rhodomonas_salina.1
MDAALFRAVSPAILQLPSDTFDAQVPPLHLLGTHPGRHIQKIDPVQYKKSSKNPKSLLEHVNGENDFLTPPEVLETQKGPDEAET